MSDPAADGPPLGRAPAASQQIAQAVAFIRERQNVARISLIADSWGTMAVGHFATVAPDLVDRLVLFGPITRRAGARSATAWPAYRDISLDAQWERFIADVLAGEPPVLLARHFADWGRPIWPPTLVAAAGTRRTSASPPDRPPMSPPPGPAIFPTIRARFGRRP